VNGFDEGESLALEIKNENRSVPILVVSRNWGDLALPELDIKLTNDLAGVADVVIVDEDAAWALTDGLGKSLSCYRGGVRLYWPQFSTLHEPYRHPLWTAEQLRLASSDLISTLDNFRRQLRSQLFRAAALCVVRPREIDGIRDATTRNAISQLRQRANSLQEYKELADTYATANDQLQAERVELASQVEQLKAEIVKIEAAKRALLAHLQQTKVAPESLQGLTESEEILPESGIGDDAAAAPKPGDTRFYKKKYSRPAHDVMISVGDCGCNNWQSAHSADKARKGISRLENGRTDWRTLHHCASCTGGGVWMVRW